MDYQDYLQSDHWKKLSAETKRLAGNRCQVCNSPDNLNTHHRTYERKGDELQSDLVCLCNDCHKKFHDIQEPAIVVTVPAGYAEIIKLDATLFSVILKNADTSCGAFNHIVCPVCGNECNHFFTFEKIDKDNKRGWDSSYILSFSCEANHDWNLCIGYSNGENYIYSEVAE